MLLQHIRALPLVTYAIWGYQVAPPVLIFFNKIEEGIFLAEFYPRCDQRKLLLFLFQVTRLKAGFRGRGTTESIIFEDFFLDPVENHAVLILPFFPPTASSLPLLSNFQGLGFSRLWLISSEGSRLIFTLRLIELFLSMYRREDFKIKFRKRKRTQSRLVELPRPRLWLWDKISFSLSDWGDIEDNYCFQKKKKKKNVSVKWEIREVWIFLVVDMSSFEIVEIFLAYVFICFILKSSFKQEPFLFIKYTEFQEYNK